MQPYFFPYLGYFDLIHRTDKWVVFDVVKYAPHSWMNRNRILHPSEGWQYITVPVRKHAFGEAIQEITLVDKDASHRKVVAQLMHYRRARAPFFREVQEIVDRAFTNTNGDRLRDLNVQTLDAVCKYLGITFEPVNFSALALSLPTAEYPGQWPLELSTALGADVYLNAPGGRDLFRPADWAERGITLAFADLVDFRYSPGPYEFIEHLSILDVLMWNAPEDVKSYLDRRKSLPQRSDV